VLTLPEDKRDTAERAFRRTTRSARVAQHRGRDRGDEQLGIGAGLGEVAEQLNDVDQRPGRNEGDRPATARDDLSHGRHG
jgi:hypothetical protein